MAGKTKRVAKLKRAKPGPRGSAPTVVDWTALHKTAAYLERAGLAEYVEMMNHPWKSLWRHLLAGLARGVGIVIGGSLVGVVLVVALLAALKSAFHHAGGMPIVGEHMKDFIGWILDAVHQHQDAGQ